MHTAYGIEQKTVDCFHCSLLYEIKKNYAIYQSFVVSTEIILEGLQ